MVRNRSLVLAHLWLAFAVFGLAVILGVWQMWVRSPLHARYADPGNYFLSVTAHGTVMAYVLTTFFVMGFGYFVTESALQRNLPAQGAAWAAYILALVGTLMAVATILSGDAAVLYTFYPPLTASPFYYIGLVLVVVASWIWCWIMFVAMAGWKRANPGMAVPLARAPLELKVAGPSMLGSECPDRHAFLFTPSPPQTNSPTATRKSRESGFVPRRSAEAP